MYVQQNTYVAKCDTRKKVVKRSIKADETGTLKENQIDPNSHDDDDETQEKARNTPRVIRKT